MVHYKELLKSESKKDGPDLNACTCERLLGLLQQSYSRESASDLADIKGSLARAHFFLA